MLALQTQRLLSFARELQRANTFEDLLAVTRAEVEASLGYHNAWLFVAETEDAREVRLLAVAGDMQSDVWSTAPVLKIEGDAMLEEIFEGDAPVVVEDARSDPRTDKAMVAALGNRTIVNVPLRLLDKPLGAFGTGTFGDAEGCRPPTPEQLDYLVGMAGQLAVAAGRIRFLEERARAAAALTATEEQLRQAQKMEAIGNLAGSVAHDFNNALSVILSYSELLIGRLPPDDPSRRGLEQIARAGHHAADLTRQLLAFSRHQVVAPRVVDLGESVAAMEPMIRQLLGEGIEVIVAPRSTGRVLLDPGQLEQVVMNLVVNARDAMPGGGRLTIETADVAPGPHVRLAVSDTGVGMDEATQRRIFEPFFTTKPRGQGTGLGLSTAYGIVRQAGGEISVTSELGHGTTFRIELPCTEELPVAPTIPDVATLSGSEAVLLVEDDVALRGAAREILEANGYRVLEARDAHEAEALSDTEPGPIDLLLSDVVMPGRSGPDLAARLAAKRPQMRTLFMSGYTELSLAHQAALARGPSALLQKPITPDMLLRRVRELLDAP